MLPGLRRGKGKAHAAPENEEAGEDDSPNNSKKPFALQKPANTALRQQRLKAWQPILTHATVLPLLLGVGVLFAIMGAVMYWTTTQVNELILDYSDCRTLAPNAPYVDMPQKDVTYKFHKLNSSALTTPQWSVAQKQVPAGNPLSYRCTIQFSVPNEMAGGVFMYYRLTNYYQNHRRYLKSMDYSQLLNKPRSAKDLHDGQCKPVGRDEATGKGIYPCGLIANSVFNDTFSDPQRLDSAGTPGAAYVMSEKNLVWSGEVKRYRTPTYNPDDIVPPPFWSSTSGPFSYPNGYTKDNLFDPTKNEHFQVWMRTAGMPTFRKLYKRNDDEPLTPGRYTITIDDNYPVAMFGGTKSVILSTTSWTGGRNVELGVSHIAVAGLCFLIALLLAAKQLFKPRRVGDLSYLSWNTQRSGR